MEIYQETPRSSRRPGALAERRGYHGVLLGLLELVVRRLWPPNLRLTPGSSFDEGFANGTSAIVFVIAVVWIYFS